MTVGSGVPNQEEALEETPPWQTNLCGVLSSNPDVPRFLSSEHKESPRPLVVNRYLL